MHNSVHNLYTIVCALQVKSPTTTIYPPYDFFNQVDFFYVVVVKLNFNSVKLIFYSKGNCMVNLEVAINLSLPPYSLQPFLMQT